MQYSKTTQPISFSFRKLIFSQMKRLQGGLVRLDDVAEGESYEFGDAASSLQTNITVHHAEAYKKIATGGNVGAAEAFMDGDWSSDNLTDVVRIFVRNLDSAHSIDATTSWLRRAFNRFLQKLRANTVKGAKSNIAEHYDLGNDFYSLWLDQTMNYSCALFEQPGMSLAEASTAKMDRACRQLDLKPGEHLLEIGTGWGGLAMHAATHFGCQVTSTTISDEQYNFARERVAEAGLQDQVTILDHDYRDLEGRFDKLVSVEMIEAVGHEYLPTFFDCCGKLLKPDGMMLLQAIVIADQRYEFHRRSVDFVSKYIFPGGALPCISKLTELSARSGGFRMLDLLDIGPHYAETLKLWRHKFTEQLPAVRELGFDERFVRMWFYYLSYCEAAFIERQINCVQMLLSKRQCRFDPISDSSHNQSHFAGSRRSKGLSSQLAVNGN